MQIVCILFPDLTQLDLTGPYEVFHRLPGAEVHLVAASLEPVMSEGGLAIVPTLTFQDAPQADVLFVPGGTGVNEAMLDDDLIAFLRRQGERAAWVTSACTGALLLGAAGLLAGFQAATHWASMEFLEPFGAWPVAQRVVVSGNRLTGGGVTAGIDIALELAARITTRRIADEIQLAIEYGNWAESSEEVRTRVLEKLAPMKRTRARAVAEAAKKLSS
ncbi:MAG TPA: DJ-1/PfpI family protein [Thermoanaerobaculia bacterium]|nr:DJ-1/PfpI family protein [Thermoanaerobaculia bacterium]